MSQLKMYWFAGTHIEEHSLPDGYSFTNYKDEKDKSYWVEICKNGLVPDDSDDTAFDNAILSREDIVPERDVFFLDYNGEHIGTFAAYSVSGEERGNLHMVGIRTDFRGKGLCKYMLSLACSKLEKEGCPKISLTTDEWRVGAVKAYLTAGFLPVEYDMNMENRWNNMLETLGIDSVKMVYDDGSDYKTIYRKGLTKKIRFGVFGGARGKTFMEYCGEFDDAELVAICEMSDKRVAEIKEKFDCTNITFYKDFDEFIKHDMDAVCLANYANEHAPYAIKAMRAGKHVISEVLPVQNLREAVELIEATEETGKIYAYAENYCYMPAPKTMAALFAEGKLGTFEYGEGEYMHNCEDGWPVYSACDPLHWRNTMSAFYYCTHSIGPLIHIAKQRPVKVTGFEAPFNDRMYRMGAKAGPFALEIITLESGAILKSIHGVGPSKNSVWYSVYGSAGRLESAREDAEKDGVRTLYANIDSYDGANDGKAEEYDTADSLSDFSTSAGHGGSDAYVMFNFVQKIKGNRNVDVVDVYEAMDMFLPGIFAYFSVLHGGIPVDVPDLRKPEEREKWRNNTACTDPKNPDNEIIPSYSKGNPDIPAEVYETLKQKRDKENK